jgi:hypothetical protein
MIDGIKTLLNYFRDERHRREDGVDQALLAIYVATNETKLYVERVRRTGVSVRATEEQLSRLWTKAAVPIRRFDRDLADRCLLKGEYWVNPSALTVEQINLFRLGLNEVFRDARELLNRAGL